MCGVAGIATMRGGDPPPAGALRRMCDEMRHRGPDDLAVEACDGVGFGFTRLAVIDIDGGRQPMTNEDGSVRLIFNGEIYNYRELRAGLARRGHEFRTQSDTEVIAHLWEEYGESFTDHLNGMFAIALHDRRSRRLVLARDHLGIKPLYIAATRHQLLFGSEIKVLLASGLVKRHLDVDALGQFLSWEYIPGRATLLDGVRKLEPAEMLIADLESGEVRWKRYWDIPSPSSAAIHNGNGSGRRSSADWDQRIDETITRCVQRQMVSDVPLGAFLSGGVDSSLVVAAMGENAHTYSIGFDDPSYNELPWSRRVAAHLGVPHATEIIRPDAAELFDHLMHFMDDPIADVSIFPTFLVSRHARREVTVALSGDGGDELFGGYETHLAQARAAAMKRVPAAVCAGVLAPAVRACRPRPQKKGLINKARRFLEGIEHDAALGHARWRLFVGEAMRAELFTPEAQAEMITPVGAHIGDLFKRADAAGCRDETDRWLYVDVKSYLTDNCLVKVDRMSMACSLEVRVPLLDRELVEAAFAMPASQKVTFRGTKRLLKRLAARRVPRSCAYRAKEGFSIPMKHWLRRELRPLVEELLAPARLEGAAAGAR